MLGNYEIYRKMIDENQAMRIGGKDLERLGVEIVPKN